MLQVAPVEVQPVAFLHATSGQVEFGMHPEPARHVASHRHELRQSTPPLHAPLSHVTEHDPGPHVTPVGQALGPQLTAHADESEQSTPPPQALAPQPTVHGAEPQRTPVAHEPGSQVIEQLDDAEQSTVPLHVSPRQRMMHCPAPHETSLGHDPAPEHVMSQPVAPVQSTRPLHDPEPLHVIRHGTPGGQRTPLKQLDDAEQSRTHTAPSQVPPVHAARHAVMAASDVAPSNGGVASGGTGVPPAPDSETAPPPVPAPPLPPELASGAIPPAPPFAAPPLVEPPEPAEPSSGETPPALGLPAEASRAPLPPVAVFGGDTCATSS